MPAPLKLRRYQNLVSKIDTGGSEDRPSWMGKVDVSGLKIRVVTSIVAIRAIALLNSFMELNETGTSPSPTTAKFTLVG